MFSSFRHLIIHTCAYFLFYFFFFKPKTAYEMRISDWSSDVCSSDLDLTTEARAVAALDGPFGAATDVRITGVDDGTVMLRDSLAGPALDAARGVLDRKRVV